MGVTSPSGEVTLADARVSSSSHEPKKTYPTESSDAADPNIILKFVQPWQTAIKGPFYAYLTASQNRNAIYTGKTESLPRRNEEHKRKNKYGFTNKYNADRLVYFEACLTAHDAAKREERLKKWRRSWKIALIEAFNPAWDDLYEKTI